MRDRLEITKALDGGVSALFSYLAGKKVTDDTLMIYTSDCSPFLGQHGMWDKRFMYEESLHVPLLMRYPKYIKAGSKSDKIALNIDLAPTILDIAGVKIPADLQGESLLPVMKESYNQDGKNTTMEANATAGWRKSMYYHYYDYPGQNHVRKHFGVRTETAKLMRFYGDDIDEYEMYDLTKDPQEMNNVYNKTEYADTQKALKAELKSLIAKYKDDTVPGSEPHPHPSPKPDPDPHPKPPGPPKPEHPMNEDQK